METLTTTEIKEQIKHEILMIKGQLKQCPGFIEVRKAGHSELTVLTLASNYRVDYVKGLHNFNYSGRNRISSSKTQWFYDNGLITMVVNYDYKIKQIVISVYPSLSF